MSEWETASFWSKFTFSVANRMLKKGSTSDLQFDDLVEITKNDFSNVLVEELKIQYKKSTAFYFIPKLFVAFFNTNRQIWILISLFMLLEGIIRILLPVSLIFLLGALNNKSLKTEQYQWAFIISGLSLFQSFVHHIVFYFSMKIGWNWKNACTALIHEKLFELNASTLQSSGNGAGKLVNLISNDVARFEDLSAVFFCTYSLLILIYIIYND
jgi:ATP-binding cassette subfamily C (CFTR/MRP) protein 4